MMALSRIGPLLAVALVTCAALATGADADHRAVTINPDNTAIEGIAANPTLNYEGSEIVCPEGTASGTIGNNSDIVDISLTFGPDDECTIAETLPASVDCSGTARWHVLTPFTGEIDRLNPGFLCTVTVLGVCEVTVAAQDLPSEVDGLPGRNRADPIDGDTIDVVVDAEANSSNATCGPAQGDGGFSGVYNLDPALSFD